MFLNRVILHDFKNIAEADIPFSPKVNYIYGSNGAGKTNLLDAVYYLSFCHSMFSNVDSLLMKHDTEFFMIQGEYLHDDGETEEEIFASMKRGSKKQFKRNKKNYKRLSDHIGIVPLIIVSPDDATLISGGSEERRKLLDIVISQYDNSYINALNRYNKALQQRNALLKMEDVEPDPTLMDLWEEEMAREGEYIY
ncbi:MAG: AAA family ATPase, partial [Bacteroidales bacterium]|nr:AAA family ATPase [Bacteroidales bacterium]